MIDLFYAQKILKGGKIALKVNSSFCTNSLESHTSKINA
jgi:hypothetical protein